MPVLPKFGRRNEIVCRPQPPATRGRFGLLAALSQRSVLCWLPSAKCCCVRRPLRLEALRCFRCCARWAWSKLRAYNSLPLLLCCCIHGPVPLFAVCLAAKRDMPERCPQLKNKLRALSIATRICFCFSAMTLAGVALVYVVHHAALFVSTPVRSYWRQNRSIHAPRPPPPRS